MAIFYYKDFSEKLKIKNFGDDINPWLMSLLFNKTLTESDKICLVGVGTILNKKNILSLHNFERKVVFTSGVGYGNLITSSHRCDEIRPFFDNTWDFACVRGPRSAKMLGLAPELGICDGAILISDQCPAKAATAREGIVFIPHVNSHLTSGIGLERICHELSIGYLPPSAPFNVFIDAIQSARYVITEAMHGAILADTMRTPWVPVKFLHHYEFKWLDWFESVDLPYEYRTVEPVFWDKRPSREIPVKAFGRNIYSQIKRVYVMRSLRRLLRTASPILSTDDGLAKRKKLLYERVYYINDTYSG